MTTCELAEQDAVIAAAMRMATPDNDPMGAGEVLGGARVSEGVWKVAVRYGDGPEESILTLTDTPDGWQVRQRRYLVNTGTALREVMGR